MMKKLFLSMVMLLGIMSAQAQSYSSLSFYHADSIQWWAGNNISIRYQRNDKGQYYQVITPTINTDFPVSWTPISVGDSIGISPMPFFQLTRKIFYIPKDNSEFASMKVLARSMIRDIEVIALPDWLKLEWVNNNAEGWADYHFSHTKNYGKELRQADVIFKSASYNISDTLHVIECVPDAWLYGKGHSGVVVGCQPAGDSCSIPIVGNQEHQISLSPLPSYVHRLPDTFVGGQLNLNFRIEASLQDEERYDVVSVCIEGNEDYTIAFYQPESDAPSAAEQKEALKTIYNSTDGEGWTIWKSPDWSAPLSSCFGGFVSNNIAYVGNYVTYLHLQHDNLTGKMPEAFAKVMYVHGQNFDIGGNRLYGPIPKAVLQHPKWDELKWKCVFQHPGPNKELLDCEGSGLKCPNLSYKTEDMQYADEEEGKTDQLFSANKLTAVFGGVPSEAMVNVFLSYKNKGLGATCMMTNRFTLARLRQEMQHDEYPEDISAYWENDDLLSFEGDGCCLFDENGNLIHYFSCNLDYFSPEEYAAMLDSVCRARLGNPEEHAVFSTRKYLHVHHKEQQLINTNSSNLNCIEIEFDTNIKDINKIQWEILGRDNDILCIKHDVTYDLSDNEGRIQFLFSANDTERELKAQIVLRADDYDIADTVSLTSLPVYWGHYNMIGCAPEGGIIEIPVEGETIPSVQLLYINDLFGKFAPNDVKQLPDTVGSDGLHVVRLLVKKNPSGEMRERKLSFLINGVQRAHIDMFQFEEGMPSSEDMKKALQDLYNATNGDQWKNKENWMTSRPIGEWYGLGGYGNYPIWLNLNDNNLVGELPESAEALLNIRWRRSDKDDYSNWQLDMNGLYGKIPESVKNHPRWQKLGWHVVCQNYLISDNKFFEPGEFNLKIADSDIQYLLGDSTATLYHVLQQNELTLVLDNGLTSQTYLPSALINQYLAYCEKSLGMVIVSKEWLGFDKVAESVKERQEHGFPKSIVWTAGDFDKHGTGAQSMRIYDKNGSLILYVPIFLTGVKWYSEEQLSQTGNIFKKYLGEPLEHQDYKPYFYTSTDYSQDGVTYTLQKATQGKGIDIVLMGNQYVDRDMNEGGRYEADMQQSMENLFSVEPMKSLRPRFNVYAVKVVSPNEVYYDGGVTRITADTTAINYACRIKGIDKDYSHICIVYKDDHGTPLEEEFVSGKCYTYSMTQSISLISGVGGRTIIHEVGGHGIGKLDDEYLSDLHYPFQYITAEEKEKFMDNFANDQSENHHPNLSATENLDEVIWSHLLKDNRYNGELGIYKGAYFWPEDVWRPSYTSIMNDLSPVIKTEPDLQHFNAPSREAIYKSVMRQTEGSEWQYDYETFVQFDAPAREEIRQQQSNAQVQKRQQKAVEPKGKIRTCGGRNIDNSFFIRAGSASL